MEGDTFEITWRDRHIELADPGDVRRIVLLPFEVQVVTLARDDDGRPYLRDGEVAEDVRVLAW